MMVFLTGILDQTIKKKQVFKKQNCSQHYPTLLIKSHKLLQSVTL